MKNNRNDPERSVTKQPQHKDAQRYKQKPKRDTNDCKETHNYQTHKTTSLQRDIKQHKQTTKRCKTTTSQRNIKQQSKQNHRQTQTDTNDDKNTNTTMKRYKMTTETHKLTTRRSKTTTKRHKTVTEAQIRPQRYKYNNKEMQNN